MTRSYDFAERDSWATQWIAEHMDQLRAAYKHLLPEAVFQQNNPGDNPGQRAGIDRVLIMPDGQSIPVDEKIRDYAYGRDILLEHVSNTKSGAPGWMNKRNPIGYLHCIYTQNFTGVLLGWQLLSSAWAIHRERWIKLYRPIAANNRGYQTLSVAVPTGVLIQAGVNVVVYPFPRPPTPKGSLPPLPSTSTRTDQLGLFGKVLP